MAESNEKQAIKAELNQIKQQLSKHNELII